MPSFSAMGIHLTLPPTHPAPSRDKYSYSLGPEPCLAQDVPASTPSWEDSAAFPHKQGGFLALNRSLLLCVLFPKPQLPVPLKKILRD